MFCSSGRSARYRGSSTVDYPRPERIVDGLAGNGYATEKHLFPSNDHGNHMLWFDVAREGGFHVAGRDFLHLACVVI